MPNDQEQPQIDNNVKPQADVPAIQTEDMSLALEGEPSTNSESTPSAFAQELASPANASDSMPQPQAFAMNGAPTNGKKKWIIGGIAAAAVLVLGVGTSVAYAFYQQPEKVVTDGLVSTFREPVGSGKLTINYSSPSDKVKFVVDAKSNGKVVNGTINVTADVTSFFKGKFEASVGVVGTIDGDGYLKINDIEKVVDQIVKLSMEGYTEYDASYNAVPPTPQQKAAYEQQLRAFYKPYVDKLKERWVKFPASKSDNGASARQKCYSDVLKKVQADKKLQGEIVQAYEKNRFVVIKDELGLKDGSYGYEISVDNDKSESFGKDFEKTKVYKDLQACDKTKDSEPSTPYESTPLKSEDKDDPLKDTRIEVWVSQWSHQLTAIKSTTDNKKDKIKVVMDLEVDYAMPSGVTVPDNSITYEDLEAELRKESKGPSSAQSLVSPLSSSIFKL